MSATLFFSPQLALAQFTQQSKLVGTGGVGTPQQGISVALSADGNTAIVGGPTDSTLAGAAWVYTRSAGVWAQQGAKLVGTGAVGGAGQGSSVALNASSNPAIDGNTAIVGGPFDTSSAGAAWVFTRSGTSWTQQSKLVGTGAVGFPRQGSSVALSADGNTAIVGGPFDNSGAGAAWVFTFNGTSWTQQSELVGTGANGPANQGSSVALSADGNTAIVGGSGDSSFAGAAWVFTRSGTTWTQQGSKLVDTGAIGQAFQGKSVALAADGNTAFVGGPGDNSFAGAAWVYTRSGGVWTQQQKLLATDASGAAAQGKSVALAADGNTAFVGGPEDSRGTGAAPGRRGSTPAAAVSGPSNRSWSAPARLEAPHKATPSRWPPTATPPSSAGVSTTLAPGRRGSLSSRRPLLSVTSTPGSSSTSTATKQKMPSRLSRALP
jgi:hypothetical protein